MMQEYAEGIGRVNEAKARLVEEIANNIVRGSSRTGRPSDWLPAVIEAVEQLAMSPADPFRILGVRDTEEMQLMMAPANASRILEVLRGESANSVTYKMARIAAEQAAENVAGRLEQVRLPPGRSVRRHSQFRSCLSFQAELASASKPWGTDTGKVYAEIKQESARVQASRGGSLVLAHLQLARRACCDAMLDLPKVVWLAFLLDSCDRSILMLLSCTCRRRSG